MRGEGEEPEGISTAVPVAQPAVRPGLSRVPDSGSQPRTSQEVTLRREFKGLRVQDLLREGVSEQLPGRAVRALEAIEKGDFRSAEALLPGAFRRVLPGPWQRSRGRHVFLLLVALLLVLAVALALVLA